MRKYNPKEINLQIDDFKPFSYEHGRGIKIQWSSDIGFGEYMIYKEEASNKWEADSETMDSNDDKEFITELMRIFIEELPIK